MNLNQIKRQSSFTEPFNWKMKRRRNGSYLASKDLITSIEDLPNEIFYEIFDYLDGYDIYQVFFDLNIRFQQLFTSSSLLFKIKFTRRSLSEVKDRCKHFVVPYRHQIISLEVWDLLTIDEFSKQCIIDSSFTHLQSITLDEITSDKLMTFLFYFNSLPRLSSLTIFFDSNDFYNLSAIYRMILQFHSLKYNRLFFVEETELIGSVPFAVNEQFSNLEYLNMGHKCTLNELISILYHTPQLRCLTCGELLGSNEDVDEQILLTLPYLTCIRIYDCFMEFNEFEKFVKNISSQLKKLDIWRFCNEIYIDPDRWKQLILQHIPHLLEFHVECLINIDDNFKEMYFDAFIEQFNSRFWIDHKWILGLEFSSKKLFYSIKSNRKLWCQLNENVDMITYSNQSSCHDLIPNINKSSTQFFQTIELSIMDSGCLASSISITDKLYPMLIALQINSLYVYLYEIPISTFLTLIHLLPNLHSLRVSNLPLLEFNKLSNEHTENFRLASDNNKITKVWLPRKFKYAEFLIDLCPRIKYLNISWMIKADFKKFVRLVLMKTMTCIPHLHSLQMYIHNGNDEIIRKLQKMINLEKLRTDFIIKRSGGFITLQLKSE